MMNCPEGATLRSDRSKPLISERRIRKKIDARIRRLDGMLTNARRQISCRRPAVASTIGLEFPIEKSELVSCRGCSRRRWSNRHATVMKGHTAHLGEQSALTIQRFPKVGKNDVGELHDSGMNWHSANPTAVIARGYFSGTHFDAIRRKAVKRIPEARPLPPDHARSFFKHDRRAFKVQNRVV